MNQNKQTSLRIFLVVWHHLAHLGCLFSVFRAKLRRETQRGSEKVVQTGRKCRFSKGQDFRANRRSSMDIHISQSQSCECGLGHAESPEYLVMGNVNNGRFYARGFHLYDRQDDAIKQALRRIRRVPDLCNLGVEGIIRTGEAQNGRRTRALVTGRRPSRKHDDVRD